MSDDTTTGPGGLPVDDSPLQPLRLSLADLFETVDLRDRLLFRAGLVDSPVGTMVACWNEFGLAWLRLRRPSLPLLDDARACGRPVLHEAAAPRWLADAVATVDTGVPVELMAVPPFQRAVLEATRRVPRGQTRPYAWVAEQVGNPRAVRAVGTALARNPVPLVVPCHRVVRSDGSAGNYLFGGEAKRHLLELECDGLGVAGG